MRKRSQALAGRFFVCVCMAFSVVFALQFCYVAVAKEEDGDAAALLKRLEESREARLDVELKTGKAFVRCKLMAVIADAGKNAPRTLRIQDGETGKTIALSFSSIRSLSIDRENVYEAAATGKLTGKAALTAKQAKADAEAEAKWLAKAKENKMPVWEKLTPEQHDAAIAEHESMIEKIKKSFSDMELYETHEFMFCSNMPRNQVMPYAASLDKMYDMMCDMYRIKKGSAVWRGKCLVVAFVEQSQFMAFEREFFESSRPLNGVYGLCHQASNGRVVISCYRGDDPGDFGQMLVHETSHGFIFRHRTPARLPSWVNEGMAEWIGQTLVPTSKAVKYKEQAAFQFMRSQRNMGGMFTADPINGIQYGMAYSLNNFLIQTDKRKYADFIDGIKQGKEWEASLQDAFKATPAQLLTAYGKTIGIPDLQL